MCQSLPEGGERVSEPWHCAARARNGEAAQGRQPPECSYGKDQKDETLNGVEGNRCKTGLSQPLADAIRGMAGSETSADPSEAQQ